MTMYAEVKGTTIIQCPYGFEQLQTENPTTNYGGNYDFVSIFPQTQTAIANGYTLVPVTPFVTPAGQVNVGSPTYAFVNGSVVETYATQPAPAPIYECQVWQIKAVLTSAQMTAVEAAINASPSAGVLNAFWSTGDEPVPSNSTTLQALGAAIGMTADQVTALVQAASKVVIP